MFQKFDLYLADPSYTLQIKQALTIKPKGLIVRAVARRKVFPSPYPGSIPLPKVDGPKESGVGLKGMTTMEKTKTVCVLYGSNTGTCEGLAQRVVSDAAARGVCGNV